jgi:putative membrane protein
MSQRVALFAGILLLLVAWAGPLPGLAHSSFTAHMALHLIVITAAAPLIAIGLGGTRMEYALLATGLLNPIFASVLELFVVWAWHAPVLHAISRAESVVFGFEQLSFLLAGILLWLSAFGRAGDIVKRAGAGVLALLMTSMHMTLLGALLVLSRRPFYAHHGSHGDGPAALADQQIGGLLMLAVGGSVYLAAGLWLLVRILRSKLDRNEPLSKELHRLTQVQP